ncbi:DoxX family protein [Pedobacter agri]|uniref:DoxX family protein n=1 Tax=Pedobacter agri TaxID=454586 RepID=UPI002930BDB7|nr:DoxX family protein [Pedobacter agri]
MNLLKKIQIWGDQHHPKWLDYFRILLGLILVWKGISFYTDMDAFSHLMRGAVLGTAVSISILAHLIIVIHILGGIAIALGTHTRLFCLLNLPILIGAVLFVNIPGGIFKPYSEFWFSSIVLIGLVCFIIEGNGILSVEREKAIG